MTSSRITFAVLLVILALAQACVASVIQKRNLGPVTIFQPPSDFLHQKSLYGRILQLHHGPKAGALLSTWEYYSPIEPVYFPIFESRNRGVTWHNLSKVTDQKNHYGNRYQPMLYELPADFASFRRGDILLAGNSIPNNLSTTQINLYVSRDQGLSWSYVSTVANGGEAEPDNGLTPVWEPFLMLHENKLICYYSDQRDPKYGQKLSLQTTTDGHSWSDVTNVVTSADYSNRPGMPIVSRMGNGQFILTYENLEAPEGLFAAYYRISSDPLAFEQATGRAIKPKNAPVPLSSPYNVWTPFGGRNGTIIANSASTSSIFLNRAFGEGEWEAVNTSAPASYSRSLAIDHYDDSTLYIVGGGPIDGNGSTNAVRFNSLKLHHKI